jgi:hypothetical protein
MLAMDLNTFDQTDQDWRSVSEKRKGCEREGGGLIATYGR